MTARALLMTLPLAGCIPTLPEVNAPCQVWDEPGLYRFKIDLKGQPTRKAYVHVPPSRGPRDLVVMMHGAGQDGLKAEEASGFSRGADAEGFVAIYPRARGWPLRQWDATGEDDDDVRFLEALVRELYPRVCGDRVLATGFSNGGMMAHRWGCEGDAPDAIAPVSGALESDLARCEGPPVPIRHTHGTDDAVVPPEGGQGTASSHRFRSVDASMDVWRERNGCTGEPPAVETRGDTTCTVWDCEVSTELCLVDGWNHRWPGGRWAESTDADATSAIWTWFSTLPEEER